MKIVPLKPALEPIFWAHVSKDLPHYFLFALDWKYRREATEILLALLDDRIDGMMLLYKRQSPRSHIVHFRGSSGAVEALLERLDLEKAEVLTSEEHKDLILKKFEPTASHEMMLMVLHKGEERIQIKHSVVELDTSHAEKIVSLMREVGPEFWGKAQAEQVVENMGRGSSYFGIETKGKLVSISNTILTEWGGHVGATATKESHRNKGYATSLVSEAVKRILEKHSIAMIYVLTDNPPALRVYKKIGFTPYRTYFFMRGERRQ